ncbi:GAF domain-containing protein, partial [Vibrio aestuarianus]
TSLGQEYNKVRDELISSNKTNVYQKNCLHFTTLNVENAIQDLQYFESVILSGDVERQKELIGEYQTFDIALRALIEETEKQLIWPLVSLRDELFNYQSDSLYNVALYRYSTNDNKLHCKARFCDDRITRRNRSWKPGLGHVGLAYVQGEVKFCNDVEKSSELKTEKSDGKIIYRSFVSVPITNVDKDDVSYGVLVLTSRHANQFDIDKDQIFLILLSKQISLYYTVVEALILKLNQMSVPVAPEDPKEIDDEERPDVE